MKKQVISLFLAFGISLVAGAQPQEKRRAITLEEAITIARVQSVDAAVALNELKTAYWEYRTFRADFASSLFTGNSMISSIASSCARRILL